MIIASVCNSPVRANSASQFCKVLDILLTADKISSHRRVKFWLDKKVRNMIITCNLTKKGVDSLCLVCRSVDTSRWEQEVLRRSWLSFLSPTPKSCNLLISHPYLCFCYSSGRIFLFLPTPPISSSFTRPIFQYWPPPPGELEVTFSSKHLSLNISCLVILSNFVCSPIRIWSD